MAVLRPGSVCFSLFAASAVLAACHAGGTSNPVPTVAPKAFTTTVPVPAATATTVALSYGGSQLTLGLPAITGAQAGTNVGITVTSVAPSALPSVAPSSDAYVTLSLPSGAVAQGVPTLTGPTNSSAWGYGTISLPNTATTLAGRLKRQGGASYTVLFDPNALNATGTTVTLTDQFLMGVQYSGQVYVFTPSSVQLADGASTTIEGQVISPRSGSIDPSKWLVLTTSTLSANVRASTKACPSNAPECFDATIGFTNPGPYTLSGSSAVSLYFYQGNYLAVQSIYPVAAATPAPVTNTLPMFQFFPTFNEIVTPDIPVGATFGFTAANISLPDVASPPSPGPLKVTTSLGPLDTYPIGRELAQQGKSSVGTVTFNYARPVTFSAVGNLTADFCFPTGSLTTATAYVFYDNGAGLGLHAVPTTVAENDATCASGMHVSALSDFGTGTITANTNWGYIVAIP